MQLTIRYIIFFALIVLAINLPAQNLTGTWEGDLGNEQFLQLNILQTGKKICGYTHDHIKANEKSFCKAFFEGSFDKGEKILTIDGLYFLQNSGDHVLMHLQLDYKMTDGIEILERLLPKEEDDPFANLMDTVFSKLFSIFSKPKNNPFLQVDSSDYVHLKKVSDQPYEIIELMKDCIGRDRKKTDSLTKKIISKPTDSIPPVTKINTPEKTIDSLPQIILAPVEIKNDSLTLPKIITQRKNIEQSHIEVNVKTITLKVYDNAIMDGDTVSILYNGKMLLTHQLLSEKGIEITIELDENRTRNEITLFAENLGSIPPNTALIVVTAGKKRYELFASASLETNAVLVFDYKPD
jgi:hypothetical protein